MLKNAPQNAPVLVWLRKDLRLTDNPAIEAAVSSGRPILFVFIRDDQVDALGACSAWRLGLSLASLSARIAELGSKLILRSGDAFEVLERLQAETSAVALHYCRDYTPQSIARDRKIKASLRDCHVESHNGALLFEPWTVETGTGGFYRVYTPFWKNVRDREVAPVGPALQHFPVPDSLPPSEDLSDWKLGAEMNRGASVVGEYVRVGEDAAAQRLVAFLDGPIGTYKTDRDRMDLDATSGLSENLAYGEISPRQIWHAGWRALRDGAVGAEHFLKELVWREFAYHLLFHSPQILDQNWREGWEEFPWAADNADAEAWRRGQTGEPIVDAAMREMYVTGRMHNRARMIVASYLTKHLLVHWKVGQAWFAECLVDWDPASNAMGWQWVAGCGPDAAPFFRIFNPQTQAEKFDAAGVYRARFLGQGDEARSFYDAVPRAWKFEEARPLVDLKAGRARALEAYQSHARG